MSLLFNLVTGRKACPWSLFSSSQGASSSSSAAAAPAASGLTSLLTSGHHASGAEMHPSRDQSRNEPSSCSTGMEAQPAPHKETETSDRGVATLEALPCLASPPRLAKLYGVYGIQTSLGAALNRSRS